MHRSTPGILSPFDFQARFEELTHSVYTGLRDGDLDPEATFDLACLLTDSWPFSLPVADVARQLAELSVSAPDSVRLADLAGQLLEELGFQPGIDNEPRLLTLLEDALEAVKADMRATGLGGRGGWTFVDEPDQYLRDTFAGFRGSFSYAGGVSPSDVRDRASALFAVADNVQDAVMGALMTVWPVCQQHGLGVHPDERNSRAVWWCSGGGLGHVVAPVGRWIG